MRLALPTLLAALALAAPASAQCPLEPTFDPEVPTWEDVNGFELGSRPASDEEVATYVEALGQASPRLVAGQLARHSWGNRPLPYARVSRPANLRPAKLDETVRVMRGLRAARFDKERIAAEARSKPALVTIVAGVHGDEPSGTDASMRLLYELAARTDCANELRLSQLVVHVVPLVNPDGRAVSSQANAYGFDLAADWFAGTQRETEAVLGLLRRFPPMALLDARELPGTGYWLPPNADPVHHEVSPHALSAINDSYDQALREAALAAGFEPDAAPAFDLFFMGRPDVAAATTFGAAGMTVAAGSEAAYSERTAKLFTAMDATVGNAAREKDELLELWARQWPHAVSQGRRGVLEPNVVQEPGSEVAFQVPDRPVYGYFIRAERSRGDAVLLARRLRSFGVRVERLRRDATLGGARPYGSRRARRATLTAGTFWISLAQSQKHWIQALLGEQTYVPFPYLGDVSSWSNPLLMGLEGGVATSPARLPLERWRGSSLGAVRGPGPAWRFRDDSTGAIALMVDVLRAKGRVTRSRKGAIATRIGRARLERLARRHEVVLRTFDATPPPRHSVDVRVPRVAILRDGRFTGFAEFVTEQRFGLNADVLEGEALAAGALADGGYDALVVAGDAPEPGGLSETAVAEIEAFVRDGGRYVGVGRAGRAVAHAAGLTQATEAAPSDAYQVPGAAFRIRVDGKQPLGWGFEDEGWVFNADAPIFLDDGSLATFVATYEEGDRAFMSGYADGPEALQGAPVALSEEVGDGQSILFSLDPNFRGYAESTMRMFGNALLHPVAGQGAKGGF